MLGFYENLRVWGAPAVDLMMREVKRCLLILLSVSTRVKTEAGSIELELKECGLDPLGCD